MSVSCHAFLFDDRGAKEPSSYGHEFEAAFFKALGAADRARSVWSVVLRGDLVASTLCEKTTAVSEGPNKSSYTRKMDMELFRTVVWDFADAITTQWHTLDRNTFPSALGHHSIYSLALPTFPLELRAEVDSYLSSAPGYLGALEVDMGNPIQARLIGMLCADAVIRNDHVFLELSEEGYPDVHVDGASSYHRGEKRVPYGKLEEIGPPSTPSAPLSPRGRISIERFEGKRSFTLQERIIHALTDIDHAHRKTFSFESLDENPLLEASMDEDKFVRYLLDPSHPDGSSKARFFIDTLGITSENWRYLAAQFYDGLKRQKFSQLQIQGYKDGGFGARFSCTMPIVGLNGRTVMVRTAWMMDPGSVPHLTSAYPQPPGSQPLSTSPPNIVDNALRGDQRWNALHELAHSAAQRASENCVPTPMKIVGSPQIYLEGAIGIAMVCVPDARRGYARWLVRSGTGDYQPRKGAFIFADNGNSSFDRAVAYAKEYAAVLQLNGIGCTVYSRQT